MGSTVSYVNGSAMTFWGHDRASCLANGVVTCDMKAGLDGKVAYLTSIARKSLILVPVGPVMNRSPRAEKAPHDW